MINPGVTAAQDAELGLRTWAHSLARSMDGMEKLNLSNEMLLHIEAHRIGVANLVEKAADYIRDELAPKEEP